MSKRIFWWVAGILTVVCATAFAQVYIGGELEKALLENLSSDPTGATGRIYYNTSSNQAKLYNGSSWGALGSGGGGSEKNYIDPDHDAETNSDGDWNLYADAAATTPANGTGGTATSAFNQTSTAAEVIEGTYSHEFAKPASNEQGEGFSYDFTLDRGQLNAALSCTIRYQTSTNYESGDIVGFIYDKDDAALVTADGFSLNATNGGVGFFYLPWSSSDSDDYRLIFHVTETGTTAWDLFIDDVRCGAAAPRQGFAGGGWGDLDVTISGVSAAHDTWKYRREGPDIIVQGWVEVTSVSSEIRITFDDFTVHEASLPSIDTSSYDEHAVGIAKSTDYAPEHHNGIVLYEVDNDRFIITNDESAGQEWNATTPHNWAANDEFSVRLQFPATEFYGGGVLNEIADEHIQVNLKVRAETNTGGSYDTGDPVVYEDEVIDNYNAFDTSTGFFTAPHAGTYDIYCSALTGYAHATGTGQLRMKKNDSSIEAADYYDAADREHFQVSVIIDLEAGDNIHCELIENEAGSVALSANTHFNQFHVTQVNTYSAGTPAGFLEARADQYGLVKAQKQYVHGTDVTLSTALLGSPSFVRGVLVPYQTVDGAWRLRFNVALTHSSDAGYTIVFTGVTFKNVSSYYQPVLAMSQGSPGTASYAYASPNTDDVTIAWGAGVTDTILSGDLELESKPTWAD